MTAPEPVRIAVRPPTVALEGDAATSPSDAVSVRIAVRVPDVALGGATYSPNRVVVLPVPGLRGPAGTPGDGGFTFTQSTPAATWTITHHLGRHPASVTVVIDGEEVDTDVAYPDAAHIVLTFAVPVSGRAEII